MQVNLVFRFRFVDSFCNSHYNSVGWGEGVLWKLTTTYCSVSGFSLKTDIVNDTQCQESLYNCELKGDLQTILRFSYLNAL